MRIACLAALAALTAAPASAEVVEKSPNGFRLKNVAEVAAAPARVYQALGEIGRWWDPAHSYSGKAANLSLTLEPGGCFCEALDGGGVRHGVVVMAMPPSTVRIEGALGPLQDEAVTAVLTFAITAKDDGSQVVQTYHVGGAREATVRDFPAPVDQVLAAALARFARYVETGAPE